MRISVIGGIYHDFLQPSCCRIGGAGLVAASIVSTSRYGYLRASDSKEPAVELVTPHTFNEMEKLAAYAGVRLVPIGGGYVPAPWRHHYYRMPKTASQVVLEGTQHGVYPQIILGSHPAPHILGSTVVVTDYAGWSYLDILRLCHPDRAGDCRLDATNVRQLYINVRFPKQRGAEDSVVLSRQAFPRLHSVTVQMSLEDWLVHQPGSSPVDFLRGLNGAVLGLDGGVRLGVDEFVYTLGSRGAVHCHSWYLPDPVPSNNPVGAGDVLLGAVVAHNSRLDVWCGVRAATNWVAGTHPATARQIDSLSVETAFQFLPNTKAELDGAVLVPGCFDLLHDGHRRLLREAAAQPAKPVIVALLNDVGIALLKGRSRPKQNLETRTKALLETGLVSRVIPHALESLPKLVRGLRPSVVVRGDEYLSKAADEAEVCRQLGIYQHRVPMLPGFSTTEAIANG